jgi:hypothetical protein
MRSFDDIRGERWQAALLEASYGNIALVFSPMHGSEVRQLLMLADTLVDAQAQLAALDEAGLRAMLDDARPWDGGSLA